MRMAKHQLARSLIINLCGQGSWSRVGAVNQLMDIGGEGARW